MFYTKPLCNTGDLSEPLLQHAVWTRGIEQTMGGLWKDRIPSGCELEKTLLALKPDVLLVNDARYDAHILEYRRPWFTDVAVLMESVRRKRSILHPKWRR